MAFVSCRQYKEALKAQDAENNKLKDKDKEIEALLKSNVKRLEDKDASLDRDISGLRQTANEQATKIHEMITGRMADGSELPEDRKMKLGVDRNGNKVVQGSCLVTCDDYNALDTRLKRLASENGRLNSENNGLRSQLSAANNQISRLNSQLSSANSRISRLESDLASCKSNSAGNLTPVQKGKLKFNASFVESSVVANGWTYATLRIDDISNGQAGRVRSVSYKVKVKNSEGKEWLPVPSGASQPNSPDGHTILGEGTFTTNLNGRRNFIGSDSSPGDAWISVVPYSPTGSYGGAYYEVIVEYENGESYPAGSVLDYTLSSYTYKDGDLLRPSEWSR